MVLVLFLAAVFSSPLFFTHWWQLRWFRNTWWVCLIFSAIALIAPRHYYTPVNHTIVASPATPLPTVAEFFAGLKSTPDQAALDAEWKVQKKRDMALSACKLAVLGNPNFHNDPDAIENYFNACMGSRNYRVAYNIVCSGTSEHPYSLGNNPAYNYVTGMLDVGENGIEMCYVEN